MPNVANQFVIKKYDADGGNFADSAYLGKLYEIQPSYLDTMITRIFSAGNEYFSNKFLVDYTAGKGGANMQEIDSEVYRWMLSGAEDRTAASLGAVDTNAALGLGSTVFRIWLDTNIYEEPDVLVPEDPDYACEIVGQPTPYGGGYVYHVRLQGDDPNAFLPAYLTEAGRRWSKGWTSTRSEFNDKFGTQQAPASFMLESQVGAFAQRFTVTDKAWRQDGRLGISLQYTDSNGNLVTTDRFLPYAEARMHDELIASMNKQSIYGKRQTRMDDSGYWKKTSPGLREQLKDGWTEVYGDTLSVNKLKDYLLNIFLTRVNEDSREVIAMTGSLGSQMFHDMLAAAAGSFLTMDTNFIERMPDRRHLSFGAQFTHYVGPEGVGLKLYKNPLNDLMLVDKRSHPDYPNLPIDSQRFTFLDFGTNRSEGTGNIVALKVKDTYRWGYQAGTHTPTGPVKGGSVTNLIAGYTMFTEGTFGVCIKDVTRCGELIFDVEA